MRYYIYLFDKQRSSSLRISSFKTLSEYFHSSFFWHVSQEEYDFKFCWHCCIDFSDEELNSDFFKFLLNESVNKDDIFYLVERKLSISATPYFIEFLEKHGDITPILKLDDVDNVSRPDKLLCIMYILSLILGGFGCQVAKVPLVNILSFMSRNSLYKWLFLNFDIDHALSAKASSEVFNELNDYFCLDIYAILHFLHILPFNKEDVNGIRSAYEKFSRAYITCVE